MSCKVIRLKIAYRSENKFVRFLAVDILEKMPLLQKIENCKNDSMKICRESIVLKLLLSLTSTLLESWCKRMRYF